jgi:hypothetical protein
MRRRAFKSNRNRRSYIATQKMLHCMCALERIPSSTELQERG